jgi:hypothetical protein
MAEETVFNLHITFFFNSKKFFMPVPVLPFHSVAHLLCYCGDTKFMLSEMADMLVSEL